MNFKLLSNKGKELMSYELFFYKFGLNILIREICPRILFDPYLIMKIVAIQRMMPNKTPPAIAGTNMYSFFPTWKMYSLYTADFI